MARHFKNTWRSKIILAAVFSMLNGMLAVGQSNELIDRLRSVEILNSSRIDVEKILAPFKIVRQVNLAQTEKDGWGEIIEYATASGSIEAKYSTGKCSESFRPFAFDVPKGVVVQLIFFPDNPLSKEELWFKLNKLKKEKVQGVSDSYVYTDDENGVQVNLFQGMIESVELGLSEKQLMLRCEE